MTTCIWYISWKDHDPPIQTKQCQLWDEEQRKCHRNEDCPKQWEKKHG